VKSNVEN